MYPSCVPVGGGGAVRMYPCTVAFSLCTGRGDADHFSIALPVTVRARATIWAQSPDTKRSPLMAALRSLTPARQLHPCPLEREFVPPRMLKSNSLECKSRLVTYLD